MKRKLFFLLALMLTSISTWADASYNYAYKDGTAVEAGSDYFLYNIGAKRFLDNGMNWGTRATVDNAGKPLTIAEISSGVYSLYTGIAGGNGPYVGENGYMNGSAQANAGWTFTSVSVTGYSNVYTISKGEKYLVYQTNAEGDNPACNAVALSGSNNDYWIVISKAQREAVGDYTFLLQNTCFNRPWENKIWTLNISSTGTDGNNNPNQSGGNVDNRCAESYRNAFTYLQNASGTVANGKYKLYNQGFYRVDGGSDAAQIAANDDAADMKVFNGAGEGTAANMSGASTAFTNGQYVNSVSTIVTNNSLQVGIKNTNNMNWVIWNNFYLEYLGTCLVNDAVALPDGGAMDADTWYYYDVPTSDDYEFTSSNAATLTYSTDATQLTSEATGTNVAFTAAQMKEIAMTAGRLYFKTSAATTLNISYKYSVGSATPDKPYIQDGNTVTISWADASTNNPSASFAKNGTPTITFNGNSIDIATTAKGFSFTVPSGLTANTEYTLAIPADAFGYAAGSTYNEAQNITLTTPAVFDGIYYLKAAATYDGSSEGTSAAVGKYLARGLNYGTHATLDKYGLPVQITTNGNNETTIQAYDTKRYFFHANDWDCYADQASLAASSYFTVTMQNGKLLIHNNTMGDGTYLKYNTSAASDANIGIFDDGTGTNNGPIIMWATENASTHATVMQSYKDGQAATAAAAAYASGNYASLNGITTVSALEAELEANYIKGDFVSPSAIESISEKYQGAQPGSGNTTETVYSNTINITEPGFYKFSMQAFYRAANNEVTQAMHTNGVDFPPVVLYFGNSETQIKSIYDEGGLDQGIAEGYFETETVGGAPVQYNGKWYTNGQHNSVIIFQKDYYHNDVYFYASEPGTYEYGVKYMGWACANAQWFIYSPESVEITSYAAAADAADYTALQNAIDAYDAATWGFEKDEYAPYNNVEAISNIAAAKAIDQEATNSKLLVNSLTSKLALSAANATDVDAIYNGMFATVASGQNYPDGWTRTNDWGQMQSGISGDYATAYYNQPGSLQYGNQGVYTMPLAANTIYKLTFAYRSHEENSNTGMTVAVLNDEDEGLAATTYAGNGSTTVWKLVSQRFITGDAGNYVLTLGNSGNTWMTNVSLVKENEASEITISENATEKPLADPLANVTLTRTLSASYWNTFSVPFDMDIPDGWTVKEFSSATDNTLNFTEAKAIVAGKPYLVKPTSNVVNPTFDAVTVVSTEGITDGDGSYQFAGQIYNKSLSTDGTIAYLDTEGNIKKLTSGGIKGLRAYFIIPSGDSSARIAFIDDPTAINTIEEAESDTDVQKDGKYLIEGKIVIVKNGVKYSANGQKLN